MGTRNAAASVTDDYLRERLGLEQWYHRFLHHKNASRHQRALYFTDNVVVAAPADDDTELDPILTLQSMLWGAATYVVGLAIDTGLAYRGAVAFGPAYVDETAIADDLAEVHMAHGSGLIEAVDLEENCANYPRVVLAPGVIREVRQRLKSVQLPMFGVRLLRDESDDVVFLDHLGSALYSDPNRDVGRDRSGMRLNELLDRYRSFILAGLAHDGNVHSKYLWLARYFNATLVKYEIGQPIPDVGVLNTSFVDPLV